jgi:hypothetical protein
VSIPLEDFFTVSRSGSGVFVLERLVSVETVSFFLVESIELIVDFVLTKDCELLDVYRSKQKKQRSDMCLNN